jgi:hypothetical protein
MDASAGDAWINKLMDEINLNQQSNLTRHKFNNTNSETKLSKG